MDFIEVPDGLIRKDLIRSVRKYERERYEGGTYYCLEIIEENNIVHNYEKLDKGGAWSNGQKEWRDNLYFDIKEQLQTYSIEKVDN